MPRDSPRFILSRFRDEWIYLGEPGWFYGTTAEHEAVKAWLATVREHVPGNPYEWCVLPV